MRPALRRKASVPTVLSDAEADAIAAEIAESPHGMIVALRKSEAIADRLTKLVQWRENRLALICGRTIVVMPLQPGEWRCLHPSKGWQRGREGVIPTTANLSQPGWLEVRVAPDVADAIISRDLGEMPPP